MDFGCESEDEDAEEEEEEERYSLFQADEGGSCCMALSFCPRKKERKKREESWKGGETRERKRGTILPLFVFPVVGG